MVIFLYFLLLSSAYACTFPSEPLKASNGQLIQCNSKTSSCPDGYVCAHLWLGMKVCCSDSKQVDQQDSRLPLISTLDSNSNTRQGSLLKKLEKDVSNNSISSFKVVRPPGQKPQQEKEFQKEQVKSPIPADGESELLKETLISVPPPAPVLVGNGQAPGYQQVPIPLPIPVPIDVSDIYGGGKAPAPNQSGQPGQPGRLTTFPSNAVSSQTITFSPGQVQITDLPSEIIDQVLGKTSGKTVGPDIPSEIFEQGLGGKSSTSTELTTEKLPGKVSSRRPTIGTDIPLELIENFSSTVSGSKGSTSVTKSQFTYGTPKSTKKPGEGEDLPSELIENILGGTSRSHRPATDAPSEIFETAFNKSSTSGRIVVSTPLAGSETALGKTKGIATDLPSDIIETLLGKSPTGKGSITDIPSVVFEKAIGKGSTTSEGNREAITDIPSEILKKILGKTPSGSQVPVTDLPSEFIDKIIGSISSVAASFTGTTLGVVKPSPVQGYPVPNQAAVPGGSEGIVGKTQTRYPTTNPSATQQPGIQGYYPNNLGATANPAAVIGTTGYYPGQVWTPIPTLVPPEQIIPGYPIEYPLSTQTPFGIAKPAPNEFAPGNSLPIASQLPSGYGNRVPEKGVPNSLPVVNQLPPGYGNLVPDKSVSSPSAVQQPNAGPAGSDNVLALAVIRQPNATQDVKSTVSFNQSFINESVISKPGKVSNSPGTVETNNSTKDIATIGTEQTSAATRSSTIPSDITNLPKELLSFVFGHMMNQNVLKSTTLKPSSVGNKFHTNVTASDGLERIATNTTIVTAASVPKETQINSENSQKLHSNNNSNNIPFPVLICNNSDPPIILPLDTIEDKDKKIIAQLIRAGCRFNVAPATVVQPVEQNSGNKNAVIRTFDQASNGPVRSLNESNAESSTTTDIENNKITSTISLQNFSQTQSVFEVNATSVSRNEYSASTTVTAPVAVITNETDHVLELTDNITAVPNAVMLETTDFPLISPLFSKIVDATSSASTATINEKNVADKSTTTKIGLVKAITPLFLFPNLQQPNEQRVSSHIDAEKVSIKKGVNGPLPQATQVSQPHVTITNRSDKNATVSSTIENITTVAVTSGGNYTGFFGRQLFLTQSTPKYRRFGFRNVFSNVDNTPLELVAVVDAQDEKY